MVVFSCMRSGVPGITNLGKGGAFIMPARRRTTSVQDFLFNNETENKQAKQACGRLVACGRMAGWLGSMGFNKVWRFMGSTPHIQIKQCHRGGLVFLSFFHSSSE